MTSCSPGTYNSKFQLSTTCPSCPSGFYCPNSTMTSYDQFLCTRGHYCGVGTITPLPCQPGTFSNSKGNKVIRDCLSCTAGNYCSTQGQCELKFALSSMALYCTVQHSLTISLLLILSLHFLGLAAVTGPCAAGYYCSGDAISPLQPALTSTGGPCTTGHYCLQGTVYLLSFLISSNFIGWILTAQIFVIF